jgi:hypothetical protein
MTQDPSAGAGRQYGGVNRPSAAEQEGRAYEEAVEHEAVSGIDFEEHELHATGRTCVRCGQVITPEQDVRRTASGAYEHEFCPAAPGRPEPGAVPAADG